MIGRTLTPAAVAGLADVPAVSRWVHAGAVRLHTLDYGGDLCPVVVLPGITMPAIGMDFVARRLTDLCRPVVVDLRGRGLSDSAATYTLDDYGADVADIVAALGLRTPVLLGHSLGARVAAAMSGRDQIPLRGIIAVDPPMSGPGRTPYPTTLTTFLEQLTEAGRGTDADAVARSWPRWPRRERELRALWLSSCDEQAVAATHRGFESEDFLTSWAQLTSPAVLICGADSPVVTPAGLAETQAVHPSATTMVVPAAGHMVFWDNPEPALTIVRDAVSSLVS